MTQTIFTLHYLNDNRLNTFSRRKSAFFFGPYGLVQLIDEPIHFIEPS